MSTAETAVSTQSDVVFIRNLLRLHGAVALATVAEHRASLRHPPKTADEYLDTLLTQELPETVIFLQQHCDSI